MEYKKPKKDKIKTIVKPIDINYLKKVEEYYQEEYKGAVINNPGSILDI